MKLRQKIYQMFILGLKGNNAENALKSGLGGIIFFKDDIISIDDFKKLIERIKIQAESMPFLSIDQEGGRVERTENIWGGKKYLSQKLAFNKGEKFLKEQSENIVDEILNYGINLNFSPCVDVNTNPKNPIINERSFSNLASDVIKGAKIVIKAHQERRVIHCIKHFPGHGDANVDSHFGLPKIDADMREHIKPFEVLIKDGTDVDMVMVAHLHCTCFEKEPLPTSLSKNAITYLRKDLCFDGVICSDDMVMRALDKFENPLEQSIRAGVNLFIYRFADDETIAKIEKLIVKAENDKELQNCIEKSYEKIKLLKQKYGLSFNNPN